LRGIVHSDYRQLQEEVTSMLKAKYGN
jgi:hypothetical protein